MSHPYNSKYPIQPTSTGPLAMPQYYPQPQQQNPGPHSGTVEYFYVYVAESELSKVGNWILLEPDKTLSLTNLREYYSTCFGIKYKVLNLTNNQMDVQYIRYHNGYFRFPPGLDLNNTRFVAYYYSDVDDIKAFMEMADANDNYPATAGMPTSLGFTAAKPPTECNNNSVILSRSSVFEMDSILRSGAQSTPVKGSTSRQVTPTTENVSSTSDVILNEPTIEVITVQDSQDTLRLTLPPPPPGPPKPATMAARQNPAPPTVPPPSGIRSKLGPSVSSTSDEKAKSQTVRYKNEVISISDSSGFHRDRSSVMVRVNSAPKSRGMFNRYQKSRPPPQDVGSKTPLKVTLKSAHRRQVQPNKKILKIEDSKGRTTALLTKKKWSAKPEANNYKRRTDPIEEQRDQKRRRYNNQYEHYQQATDTKPVVSSYAAQDHRVLNVLLVGFHDQAPVAYETTSYFSEFGTVTNFQLYSQENHLNVPEFYACMEIRADDTVSLFSDRHVHNGTIIYAIRVDGTRLPPRVTCRVCNYFDLNVAHLAYHVEGQCHQHNLKKRLQSQAANSGQNVYLDSYYRITYDELYVQYPTNPVQEMVRDDYWTQRNHHQPYSSTYDCKRSRYANADKERFY